MVQAQVMRTPVPALTKPNRPSTPVITAFIGPVGSVSR